MDSEKPILKAITTREQYEQTFFHIRDLEGWGACATDGDLYLAQAQGKGYWAGFVNGELFCIFSFMEYPDINAVFFGSYITKREFRGKGLTYPLFKEKYEELKAKGYRFILTTADDMVATYAKSMQVYPTGRVDLFTIKAGEFVSQNLPQDKIVKGSEVSLADLVAYDKGICHYDRSISVALFRTHPELQCFVFVENGIIKGYCVLKKNKPGYKILPLLADRLDIARTLIEVAMKEVPKDEEVFIYSPHPNRTADLKDMGFTNFFSVNIMGDHPNDFERIYGIYAIDAGL